MPTEPIVPVRGRHLEALRAVALYPAGMRHEAHPSAMPVLQALGYVEERSARGRRGRKLWHLTETGRTLLKAQGERRPRRD